MRAERHLRGSVIVTLNWPPADWLPLFPDPVMANEGTSRFGYRIHACCLMTNHVHLVMQDDEIPLSRAMQNLYLRYTGWINRRESRTGHLPGRYKALLGRK